ncbi:MAG: hypothetical protein P1U58_18735 [Verrucomicrobiales bacterium]|nr:hypothetical protein [Verrucomicrobiales bacterium]
MSALIAFQLGCVVISDAGIVAQWLFEGNAADTSGNGFHLENHGAVLTDDRFGNPESAYYFNPDEQDFMEVPNLESYLNYDSDWTVNLWVKIDRHGPIMGGGDGGSNFIQWGISSSSTKFANKAERNDFRTYWGPIRDTLLSRWVMITATWDSAGETKTYHNGVLFESDSMGVVDDFYPNTRPMYLGASNSGFLNGIDVGIEGVIDDLVIYDRVLSGREIEAMYRDTLSALRQGGEFFDDFDYSDLDDTLDESGNSQLRAKLTERDWYLRSETRNAGESGNPGVNGADWDPGLISFDREPVNVLDPDGPQRTILRLCCATTGQGDTTRQSEIFTSKRFFRGTYAVRAKLYDDTTFDPGSDEESESATIDTVVCAPLYTINSESHDRHRYSEVDFEYYPKYDPNDPLLVPFLDCLSWHIPFPDDLVLPPIRFEPVIRTGGSFEGWRTFLFQILEDEVAFYVDGNYLGSVVDSDFVPEYYMQISLQMWFYELHPSSGERKSKMGIDWIYHAANEELSTGQVLTIVEEIRDQAKLEDEPSYRDTVKDPIATARKRIMRKLSGVKKKSRKLKKKGNKRKLKKLARAAKKLRKQLASL